MILVEKKQCIDQLSGPRDALLLLDSPAMARNRLVRPPSEKRVAELVKRNEQVFQVSDHDAAEKSRPVKVISMA